MGGPLGGGASPLANEFIPLMAGLVSVAGWLIGQGGCESTAERETVFVWTGKHLLARQTETTQHEGSTDAG